MSALAQPPPTLSVRTHHKFRKIRCLLNQKVRTSTSEEPLPFLSAKCPHRTTPPTWLWTSFMERPLRNKILFLLMVACFSLKKRSKNVKLPFQTLSSVVMCSIITRIDDMNSITSIVFLLIQAAVNNVSLILVDNAIC